MTTVACVLRSGGDFDAGWVDKLARSVWQHLPAARFVCVSDAPVPCERIPLVYPWPGWFCKMALFEPGVLDGRVLYLDLDTLVVGDLEDICAYTGLFGMLRDWFPPYLTNSGVMVFEPGAHTEAMFRYWMASPETHMERYRGDGDFIREHIRHDALNDLFPGQIATYKTQTTGGALTIRSEPPAGARLICGHGVPRFSSPDAGWAHDLWMGAGVSP